MDGEAVASGIGPLLPGVPHIYEIKASWGEVLIPSYRTVRLIIGSHCRSGFLATLKIHGLRGGSSLQLLPLLAGFFECVEPLCLISTLDILSASHDNGGRWAEK